MDKSLTSTLTMRLIRPGMGRTGGGGGGGGGRLYIYIYLSLHCHHQGSRRDLEILEEGGGAGPSNLPRRDHE